jgi:hypothetical protein
MASPSFKTSGAIINRAPFVYLVGNQFRIRNFSSMAQKQDINIASEELDFLMCAHILTE